MLRFQCLIIPGLCQFYGFLNGFLRFQRKFIQIHNFSFFSFLSP